jgi:hypothetical protein
MTKFIVYLTYFIKGMIRFRYLEEKGFSELKSIPKKRV